MPKKILPRIASVSVGENPFTLRIAWAQGGWDVVDISYQINVFRLYEPLRHQPELFQSVRVGDQGTDIVWTDDIDMAADTLWRLAREQSGFTMTAEAFRQWRKQQSYTLDDAAAALGISRRMIAYYDHGDRPIPRVVALATQALAPHTSPS
ncbi:MAG: helix-turn-helix transcriptional regulator [Alphaproteobacteria bacterium]|nr:helix-turn-helix transcriptional regulator [Alphaproteobacteria bacterium]